MEDLTVQQILREASLWNFNLTFEQAVKLKKFYFLLMRENKKYNLTRITDPFAVLHELFFDSVAGLFFAADKTAPELLDLGSGAGFPGIPIKIIYPELRLIILDASAKKINFLKLLLDELNLQGVTLVHGRAEDYGRGPAREKYLWVTARAVASLPVLLELALPLLQPGGYFWAYKGPSYEGELLEAEEILRLCCGELCRTVSYQLPREQKSRKILIFRKNAPVPERFPRRSGIPQKKPIIKK